jgi:hypothetical protein
MFFFNLFKLLNPSWQVVDIREFQAEHHVNIFIFKINYYSIIFSMVFILIVLVEKEILHPVED